MIRATDHGESHQIEYTNGSHFGIADLPREKGGEGDGFGPHELLEAALATCMAMTVRMVAAKEGIPLTGVTCKVRIDRSVPDEVTLHHTLSFEGSLSEQQEHRLRDVAQRCPVSRTLTGSLILKPM